MGTETLTDCDRGRDTTAEVDHTESYVSLPTAPTASDYNSQKPLPADRRMRASAAAYPEAAKEFSARMRLRRRSRP